MTTRPDAPRSGGLLDLIERLGNALPHPVTLFLLGAIAVIILSDVGARLNWQVRKPIVVAQTTPVLDHAGNPVTIHTFTETRGVKTLDTTTLPDGTVVPAERPVTTAVIEPFTDASGTQVPRLATDSSTEPVRARSLLTRDGAYWLFKEMVHNFTSFHPLGVVLVAMLGIGIAEKTGCIAALLKAMMLITPMRLLTPATVFVGVMSSMAADAGYVVLPPLAAALYKAVGRSPLAGIAAVFAGVAGGFSANLLPTSLDPLLAGLTQQGAQILDPSYAVNPLCNYFFMIASTLLITTAGWMVTAWIVEPRCARKPAEDGGPSPLTDEDRAARHLSPGEVRGLMAAAITLLIALAAAAMLIVIPGAPLHTDPGVTPQRWPDAIVPLIFLLFLTPGVAFGLATGAFRAKDDQRFDAAIARIMGHTMADMGPYIVLAFFAAQFIAYFNYSNLGVMLAIVGGDALASAALPTPLLLALFIVVVMLANLFIGSASAKYAFFAPVFVPMFMQVGLSPELTQAAYRVGDSITNVVTPLNPYFIMILVFAQKYMPKAGIGTLVSLMLPYTLFMWVGWTVLLVVWWLTSTPLGFDGGLTYAPPAP